MPASQPVLPRLLTTAQVAEALGERVQTVRRRIRRGEIPAVRLTTAGHTNTSVTAAVRVRDTDLTACIDDLEPANRTAR